MYAICVALPADCVVSTGATRCARGHTQPAKQVVVSFGTRRSFGNEPVQPSAGAIISGGKWNIGASAGRHKGLFQGGDPVPGVPRPATALRKNGGAGSDLGAHTKPVWECDSECFYLWFCATKPGKCDQ